MYEKVLIHAATWMELKNIMLSEKSQRINMVQFHLYEMFRMGKFTEAENRLVIAYGCREWRFLLIGREFLFGVMKES